MSYRFIIYNGRVYIVTGYANVWLVDPPECYKAVPLQEALFLSYLNPVEEIIPLKDAKEITDPNKIKWLAVLYKSKNDGSF